MENKKITLPTAIIIAGLLIMIGIIVNKNPKQESKPVENKSDTTILVAPLNENDHVLGDVENAELLVIEFSDIECPVCKDFYLVLKQAVEKYPIAWVYRHYPIESSHPIARNEARATECADKLGGNEIFWKYLDKIFENIPNLDQNLLPILAKEVGLDKDSFNECMKNTKELDELINTDMFDAQTAGLKGTPHNIIVTKNQTKIPLNGALSETEFNSLIESILEEF
ncbi:MAG: thioredoxin domain-containing protein [Patescibacteria group bacterium]|nr:thioredoxin domain-containing protein [Patescibacteria group bacterium]